MEENKLWWLRFIGLFGIVAGLALAWQDKLSGYQINWIVVEGANVLLLAFTLLNVYLQIKNINHPNPAAVIRGVMAGTFLKLFGIAAGALIYLAASGKNRSVNAVFVGMGLYIIYTWLEVKILLQLKPKK